MTRLMVLLLASLWFAAPVAQAQNGGPLRIELGSGFASRDNDAATVTEVCNASAGKAPTFQQRATPNVKPSRDTASTATLGATGSLWVIRWAATTCPPTSVCSEVSQDSGITQAIAGAVVPKINDVTSATLI